MLDLWRDLVNSFDDLPESGASPPQQEMIPSFAEGEEEPDRVLEDDELFVQKVVTEMYIFTNAQKQVFGEHTFQDMVILGVMTPVKLNKLLARQRKKREKG